MGTASRRIGMPSAETIAEAFAMILLVLLIGFAMHALGFSSLSATITGAVTLWSAAFIGLVAASSSCLASTGGLLLSVSASWCKNHPRISHWDKLRPLLLFNVGRLAGYFLLGGAVGELGNLIAPSVRAGGVLMASVALVMLWLGLKMLDLLPASFCAVPRSTFLGKQIEKLTSHPGIVAPLLLGALTFFLPCGFTQSMQLAALSTGSFLKGGLLMFAFAAGTLPALVGVSLLSSTLSGNASRFFFRFAGAAALVLGLFTLRGGLLQTGIDVEGTIARILHSPAQTAEADAHVSIDAEGRQVVSLNVTDSGYSPSAITIEPGKTTWIYATALSALRGCASFLNVPAYNLSTPVRIGGNWLGPIKNPQNDFVLTCSTGTLRADVHVRRS